jgi:hypothetical protein
VSRLLVILGAELISRRLPQVHNSADFWFPANPILLPLVRFDAQYYSTVMRFGYAGLGPGQPPPIYRAAFFPLYPLLGRALGGGDWSLLAISNFALLAGLLVIYVLGVRRFDAATARTGIWVLCLGPAAMFFSFPYTESLFMLLSASSILLADLRRPAFAGLAGALAAMTRVPGFLLALPLFFQLRGWNRSAGLLPPLGLLAVIALDAVTVGDPLGFLHAQVFWHGASRNPLFPVGAVVSAIRLHDLFHPEALGLPILIAFTVAAAWLTWRPATRDLGLYSLVLCALAIYQGYAVGGFQSVPRYLVVAFPCYFAFGALLVRHRFALIVWLAISAVYLTALSALYGSRQFIG